MSSFIIKLIAIISMTFDHTGDIAVGHLSIYNLIGRIAFPLFSFQLVVGYTHTKNIKKYIERMFIFAAISQVPYSFFNYAFEKTYFALNIFFTLSASLICMHILNSKTIKNYVKILSIAAILVVAYFLKFDYSSWGILYTMFVYAFYPFQEKLGENRFEFAKSIEKNNKSKKNNNLNNKITNSKDSNIKVTQSNQKNLDTARDNSNKIKKIVIFAVGTLIFSILKWVNYFKLISFSWSFGLVFFTFLPTIFMLLFNGKKGPSAKYLFYAFYPVHLIILDLIYYFI